MNARFALIPILGASALLLSGCFSTLQPAVAPQSSTTDPIAEAQYIQYNTSTRANASLISAVSTRTTPLRKPRRTACSIMCGSPTQSFFRIT